MVVQDTKQLKTQLDDQEARRLLERCALQDQKALAELHAMLAKRIYAFALHRLNHEQDAETVVIDTLHEVWKCAAGFRGDSLVSTWVLGIARYKALNLRRGTPVVQEDIEDYAEVIASDSENGEQALDRWQQEQQVHRCLDTLSTAHRECLQLVYFECLPLADVASVQGVPENTVKTRLFHARKNMRECVELGSQGARA